MTQSKKTTEMVTISLETYEDFKNRIAELEESNEIINAAMEDVLEADKKKKRAIVLCNVEDVCDDNPLGVVCAKHLEDVRKDVEKHFEKEIKENSASVAELKKRVEGCMADQHKRIGELEAENKKLRRECGDLMEQIHDKDIKYVALKERTLWQRILNK